MRLRIRKVVLGISQMRSGHVQLCFQSKWSSCLLKARPNWIEPVVINLFGVDTQFDMVQCTCMCVHTLFCNPEAASGARLM